MPDGRGESTKGIEALVFLYVKINRLSSIGFKKKGRPQSARPIIHEKTT